MSYQEVESLDQENTTPDQTSDSKDMDNQQFKKMLSKDASKQLMKRAGSIDGIKSGLSEIQYGEIEYEEQSMPDDIIKMSIFISINQAYFYSEKKSNPCKRLFQLFVMALACFVQFVQIFLLWLLWAHGLTFDKDTEYSLHNPNENCIDKIDYGNKNAIYASIIAMIVVFLLISVDLHEQMRVVATWKDYALLFWEQRMPLEWLIHAVLLILQIQYSLLLGIYSFYVVFSTKNLQSIFMNCTALLFLNEVDSYVCAVFKTFLKASEDDFFLILKKQTMQLGIKLDMRTVFLNYYPKIFAIGGVWYLIGAMTYQYYAQTHVIIVPDYQKAFFITYAVILGLLVASFFIFLLTLIPVTIGAGCCGSMDGIGQGFQTFEFDEIKEMAEAKEKGGKEEGEEKGDEKGEE